MKRRREYHSPERVARDERYRAEPPLGLSPRRLNVYGHFALRIPKHKRRAHRCDERCPQWTGPEVIPTIAPLGF